MIAYLKETITGEETPFTTLLEYTRVGNNLKFKFTCEKSQLFSAYSGYNEPIYKGDVCEVFICTGDDLREYYEIEVAPNGTAFFAKIFNENGLHTSFLEKKFSSEVTITDVGYNVEITIPYEAIDVKNSKVRFNAYRIETEGGEENKNLLALNPTLQPRFHVPERFVEWIID